MLLGIAVISMAPLTAQAVAIGGDLTYTTDYLFRGVSQTNGRGAVQFDLHLSTADGSFAGLFGSTLNSTSSPAPHDEIEAYAGHRFALSPSWSATLAAVYYDYLHGNAALPNDYEEVSAAVSYLDRWTLSLAAAPNLVRYQYGYRLGRHPSYVVNSSAQWPVFGRLFVTAGLGYDVLDGPASAEYAYGNIGLAVEYRSFRLDGGYYFTGGQAQSLYVYERVANRFAATLSWHF